MFARLGCQGRPPQFRVVLYPYASLSHTIRLRGEEVDARLSDLMRGAPLDALEAVAAILLSKLYRVRLPALVEENYRKFADSGRLLRRLDRARRRRGRRKHTGPQGRAHNLAGIFERINGEYFSGGLPATDLGWSTQTWKRQLGVFDSGMRHIVINRWLDRPAVPEHVVAYVVYHEMLHLERSGLMPKVAAKVTGNGQTGNGNGHSGGTPEAADDRCRMGLHTPEFRRAERRYRDFSRARSFLLGAGRW
ncbi:MAG TPA: hypothetical protein VKG84_14265 [Candidatus Acidoferrales bacterium]|nr:hypothetical protein [Candidatus Acidoferrales bacterium]